MLRSVVLGFAFFGTVAASTGADTVRIAHPELGAMISDKDGETVGIVADVLHAAAEHENLRIVFVPLTEEPGKALTTGAADAVAPFLIAPQNRRKYDFTATLTTSGGGLFVRAPHAAPADLRLLSGKTVVTPSFGPFVTYIHDKFPSVKVVATRSYTESLNRILAGQADAAALNVQEGARVVAQSYSGKISVPKTPFLVEPLVLVVKKGQHADVIRRLDAGLAAIATDGTLQKLEAKWADPMR